MIVNNLFKFSAEGSDLETFIGNGTKVKTSPEIKLPLKYGFCNKSLRKNETLTSCPFFHFFNHFWLGATANPTKSDKKMKKGATGQSFIRKEVSSYKIHTLAALMCKKLDVPLDP